MIKLLFVIIIAGAIYVGMNWEQVSGQVESGLAAIEEVKDDAVDMKEAAADKLDSAKEKVEELVERAP